MSRDTSSLRVLAGLLSPGGILVAAAVALQHEPVVREAVAPYLAYFAIGSLSVAILLGWYHDQARLLSAALAVALAVAALERWPGSAIHATLVATLLPLNFVLFGVLRETGVGTFRGFTKLLLVATQAAVVAWNVDPVLFAAVGPPVGDPASLARIIRLTFGAAALVLLALALRRRSQVEHGLLWALAAACLGMLDAEGLRLYSGAAGLILVLSVLEHGYDIAYRDELTGLLGRRAFNSMMERLGRTYAIAMCDVDRFKNFNDTYGHDAGDQLLRMVSTKLSQVGGGGRVFRYGGEEFLVVFRGRTADEALPFVEAVRKAVADTRFVLRGPDRPATKPIRIRAPHQPDESRQRVGITISIGLAERSHRHSTPELVLDAADAALYRAKEAGRNCVRTADSTTAEPGQGV